MAAYVKFEPGVEKLWNKEMDLFGTTDTLKVAITSDAPVVATDAALADLTQVTGTGYTAGGIDTQNDSTRTGGTITMTGVDAVWTAGAGGFTAGRYVPLYDDTPTTPTVDPLLGYWDYGSNFTLAVGETFTWDVGASILTGT